MNHETNVKYNTLETFVTTINDLGVELIIEASLKEVRKKQLRQLIDDALVEKNEQDFNRYTNEYKQLEATQIG
ncbi:IDEAL domain-containing protein [Staphylococcus massiliensis]|uniref:IDEAL domain-containing protein n=1 Tax=Staphylococcus massiliensis S46 TaxID=1229783 RepID=K9AL73_9STAP|nr:IDEAL domain-containing protein [Staphylococcus massiliensis]EKU48123.1 hypothetical protein C273_06673 [Staphylococcus massiliensis S46]MCG3399831.1 IDEAL domain-containing protein [Staphylococcus massiliensis]MCG3401568.1 IDEAL domain-containing protein [Staphylococcus massiliensis]MCG3412102.1 IDEAL domain-containing protein [Staphylococcus massiliensis]PNZ98202.1 IDEAL domain-containing protein [Staphylococcus massiliensis CCUG 55927]